MQSSAVILFPSTSIFLIAFKFPSAATNSFAPSEPKLFQLISSFSSNFNSFIATANSFTPSHPILFQPNHIEFIYLRINLIIIHHTYIKHFKQF